MCEKATQLQKAQVGKVTPEMAQASQYEGVEPEFIRDKISKGRVVLPYNLLHKDEGRAIKPVAIGEGLITKVNANIGTSRDLCDPELEIKKLDTAIASGADTVMDLSTGGDIRAIRRMIRKKCPVPMGTVPIYDLIAKCADEGVDFSEVSPNEMYETIEMHGEDGIDFITVHCGVTLKSSEDVGRRIMGVVSRGGAYLIKWMKKRGMENPLYSGFDTILDIALKYDMTLSLGDGLRPGGIADATDVSQLAELTVLGELAKRAKEAGVQVMIEGPGHIPLHQIGANVSLEKKICDGAPFYVLGPIVTDIAPGYDHITSAIGGAIAAWNGADFICYVTPAEHLTLPNVDDVKVGVISARIAAHAADIAKGVSGAGDWDLRMSLARRNLDWRRQAEEAIDPFIVEKVRDRCPLSDTDACSMCPSLCAVKLSREFRERKKESAS
ncbi:MAG TPA: phosphomethylpyrimidine synthase ThiC [Firmicutes bacterium]|nr:phosphomethylpyrimidine synthase ThiC [Bacillota bacterium]